MSTTTLTASDAIRDEERCRSAFAAADAALIDYKTAIANGLLNPSAEELARLTAQVQIAEIQLTRATERRAQTAAALETIEDITVAERIRDVLHQNRYEFRGLLDATFSARVKPGKMAPEEGIEVVVCQQSPTVHDGSGNVLAAHVWICVLGPLGGIPHLDTKKLVAVLASNDIGVKDKIIGNTAPIVKFGDHGFKPYELRDVNVVLPVPIVGSGGNARSLLPRFEGVVKDLPYRWNGNGWSADSVKVRFDWNVDDTPQSMREFKEDGKHLRSVEFQVAASAGNGIGGYLPTELQTKLTPRFEGLGVGDFAAGFGRIVSTEVVQVGQVPAPGGKGRAIGTWFKLRQVFEYQPLP